MVRRRFGPYANPTRGVKVTRRATLILFEWLDSCHVEPGAWCERDAAAEATPCGVITAGFKLEERDDAVVIASNLTEQGHASGVFVVPKACIVATYRLAPVGRLRSRSPLSRGWRSWWPFGGRDG